MHAPGDLQSRLGLTASPKARLETSGRGGHLRQQDGL
jgi:hypothetical protein